MLCALSARIAGSLRDSDLIFRWGGEEFLVVLRDCDRHNALRIADKLRESAAEAQLTVRGETLRTTISVGAAERENEESIDRLIGRADQALYAAKREGRNRSRLA
jgi:diguanylate cyclase (GGDEF)-like protein